MPHPRRASLLLLPAGLLALSLCWGPPGAAQAPPARDARSVLVGGLELSGAARVAGGVLLADDELVGAVLFVPDEELAAGGPLVARQVKLERRRTSSRPHTDLPRLFAVQDVEDLACDDQETVYVLGSHQALPAGGGWERRPDREFLIRARWRAADRELRVRAPQDGEGEEGLYTELLDDLARLDPALASGANLEGLALKGKHLLLGLRSPLTAAGKAVVLEVRADALFGTAAERRERRFKRLELDLGGGGVRGLCWDRARDRLLVLSGPSADTPAPHILWSCQADGRQLEQVHAFAAGELREHGAPEGVCRLDAGALLVACDRDDQRGGSLLTLPWPR